MCFIRKVCFLPLCKDLKISHLERDNTLQNCEINIVRILESFFVASVFVITNIGYPCIFYFQLTIARACARENLLNKLVQKIGRPR